MATLFMSLYSVLSTWAGVLDEPRPMGKEEGNPTALWSAREAGVIISVTNIPLVT